jgi:hypothetical protein
MIPILLPRLNSKVSLVLRTSGMLLRFVFGTATLETAVILVPGQISPITQHEVVATSASRIGFEKWRWYQVPG